MINKAFLMLVLLVNPFEKQHNKIKETTIQIKLAAYSNKNDSEKVEILQRLAIQLAFEVEELDGK